MVARYPEGSLGVLVYVWRSTLGRWWCLRFWFKNLVLVLLNGRAKLDIRMVS